MPNNILFRILRITILRMDMKMVDPLTQDMSKSLILKMNYHFIISRSARLFKVLSRAFNHLKSYYEEKTLSEDGLSTDIWEPAHADTIVNRFDWMKWYWFHNGFWSVRSRTAS
uniref:Uncharacterized protein n=1 Tax=Rhizophagus irregularis (strain DAOM 181602 / DAOM 197198 / MUCL 43194) TaxID=747089 RepID=U9UZ75_RHIID